jgi:hypothetical protein
MRKCGGGCGAVVALDRGSIYCPACWRSGKAQRQRARGKIGFKPSARGVNFGLTGFATHDELESLP